MFKHILYSLNETYEVKGGKKITPPRKMKMYIIFRVLCNIIKTKFFSLLKIYEKNFTLFTEI